ncbi:hypothetical protein LAZ67_11001884 [Cordylochernes scorpioides]|uniref:Reverse transcriptase domain-containing protein n=1 Tax=Cordylochernes scorpioides TaxID=51811 RepID=A0ABY6L0K0_9ARAC|nr:hypothetical protein LAZ67_11001884 [Cordylochernes scorpioides]
MVRASKRSNPAAIVERPTVRQRGIMVWGAIAYDSRSPLLRIQGTMTAQRYVYDVLRPVILPYLQGVPNALYQQDNARPHTARISQQALQDVQMLPWPPYSSDLSPIEHVWDIIGRRLHALPQPRSEDELWQMVEREWRAIPQDAIRTLINSLPRRVAACIAVRGEIAMQDWLNFYRELMTTEKKLRIFNLHNVISQNDPILDSEITNADIYKEIAGLKSNKACGPDCIPNEVLKILPDSYILLLKQLYNSVMTNGKYPAIWTNFTIHPIFKNGYKNSPSNYRGISYQFISTIRSYYEQATIAIRWKGSFAESIKINSGVLQGEPLSPLLFILFITDLIEIYNNLDLPSVNLPEFGDIHLLLYADDIAIIGESRMNLQKKIKILKEYLDENLMTLNESKSKIMVFRNGGKPSNKDRWFWNDKPITITSRYTYLGFPLTPTITTTHPANYFKGKALTAINATHPILIKSKAKSINLTTKLFDTIVRAVLMYAAPLWATEHKDLLDSIQDIFIRRFLNLPRYTPGYIIRLMILKR